MTVALDAVANAGLTPLLKTERFRKSKRTWRRQIGPDNAIQIVNLQGSMFATRAEGRCALNVALYFPALAELLGLGRVTDAPTEADAHLRRRAARLAPAGQDTWFEFDPTDSASIDNAGAGILQLYSDFGAAWLDRLTVLREARDEFARTGRAWHASAASLACKDVPAARRFLGDALTAASRTTRRHLRHWAARHALL